MSPSVFGGAGDIAVAAGAAVRKQESVHFKASDVAPSLDTLSARSSSSSSSGGGSSSSKWRRGAAAAPNDGNVGGLQAMVLCGPPARVT